MVTREQALSDNEFHYGTCTRAVGPRGGVTLRQIVCRRNGQTQTWKTRPADFRVPFKHGFRDTGAITHINARNFHAASACEVSA